MKLQVKSSQSAQRPKGKKDPGKRGWDEDPVELLHPLDAFLF